MKWLLLGLALLAGVWLLWGDTLRKLLSNLLNGGAFREPARHFDVRATADHTTVHMLAESRKEDSAP